MTPELVELKPSLNSSTRGLMSAQRIALMKQGAYLINLARGDLVDQEALVSALRDGRLAGAALDVTSPEPLPKESHLWSVDNLLLTPHISASTMESRQRSLDLFCANLRAYLAGKPELMRTPVDIDAHL